MCSTDNVYKYYDEMSLAAQVSVRVTHKVPQPLEERAQVAQGYTSSNMDTRVLRTTNAILSTGCA
jgi:hypothetical protein